MHIKRISIKNISGFISVVATVFIVGACSSNSDDDAVIGADTITATDTTDTTDTTNAGDADAVTGSTISPERFVAGALLSSEIIDCTLSDGTQTTCYEFVTSGSEKSTDMIGPFCPGSTSSTAEAGGVWLDGETIHEADGNFFLDLPNLYGDAYPPADSWILYDENGDLRVTDTLEACQAAARPDVDPEYQSFCVECSLDDLGADVTTLTFTIPTTPVPANAIGTLTGTAGISLNGFQIAAQAPVQDILSNWTIAAFDDCGGHVNPNDGYHYHAATGAEGCNSSGTETDGHPALIGFAMDGYGIYGTLDDADAEAGLLDQCNGTEDDSRGYHYHAGSPELNQHIGCFHGVTLEAAEERPPRR